METSGRGRARTEAQSRGDGVGSGSSRRKPSQRSMTPGLTGLLRAEGFAVKHEQLLLVKLPSGGFGRIQRDDPPGRFCPAFLLGFQSGGCGAPVRLSAMMVHRAGPGLANRRRIEARMASDGWGRLPDLDRAGAGDACPSRCSTGTRPR